VLDYIHFFDFFALLLATFLTGSSFTSFEALFFFLSAGFSSMLDFLFGLSSLAATFLDLEPDGFALSIIP
jgi:hypothetical protein